MADDGYGSTYCVRACVYCHIMLLSRVTLEPLRLNNLIIIEIIESLENYALSDNVLITLFCPNRNQNLAAGRRCKNVPPSHPLGAVEIT